MPHRNVTGPLLSKVPAVTRQEGITTIRNGTTRILPGVLPGVLPSEIVPREMVPSGITIIHNNIGGV